MDINNINNSEILKNFLEYLLVVKNLSIGTVERYNYNLLNFFNFIKIYNNIEEDVKNFDINILLGIKQADILAFLVYLNYYKDNSSKTRQIALGNIRNFYEWLIKIKPDKFTINPTKNIPNITKSKNKNTFLTLEQSKKLSNIFTYENSYNPTRDNTIISLFLNTGMRISELYNLNIRDINIENKTIKIIGKGNKEREIYLNEGIKKRLSKYLEEMNFCNIDEPLFKNNKSNRLGKDGITRICKKAYKLAGLDEYRI